MWDGLDHALGRGLAGQIISLGIALLAGAVIYGIAVVALRIPEAEQIRSLARRDRGTSAAAVEEEPSRTSYVEDDSGEYEYYDEDESGEVEYLEDEDAEPLDEEFEPEDEEPEPLADGLIRGLVILPGSPRAGEHFLLDQDEATIGRHPEADVFLDDRSVSREHAVFVREDDGGTGSRTSALAMASSSTAAASIRTASRTATRSRSAATQSAIWSAPDACADAYAS